jgi:hypothetical protein
MAMTPALEMFAMFAMFAKFIKFITFAARDWMVVLRDDTSFMRSLTAGAAVRVARLTRSFHTRRVRMIPGAMPMRLV